MSPSRLEMEDEVEPALEALGYEISHEGDTAYRNFYSLLSLESKQSESVKLHYFTKYEDVFEDGLRYRLTVDPRPVEEAFVDSYVFFLAHPGDEAKVYRIPVADFLNLMEEAKASPGGIKRDERGYHMNLYPDLDRLHPTAEYGRKDARYRLDVSAFVLGSLNEGWRRGPSDSV